jgi:hypothetical protein
MGLLLLVLLVTEFLMVMEMLWVLGLLLMGVLPGLLHHCGVSKCHRRVVPIVIQTLLRMLHKRHCHQCNWLLRIGLCHQPCYLVGYYSHYC